MTAWLKQNQWSATAVVGVAVGVGWLWYKSNRQRPGLQLLKRQGPDALPAATAPSSSSAAYRVAAGRRFNVNVPDLRFGPVRVPGTTPRAQEANSAIEAVGRLTSGVPEQYAGLAAQGVDVRYVGPFVVIPEWDTDFSRQHHKTGRGYQRPDSWQRIPNVRSHESLSAAVEQAQQLIARNRAAFSVAGDDGGCIQADKGGRSSAFSAVLNEVNVFEEALLGIRGLAIYGSIEISQPGQPVERVNDGQEPLWSVQFTTPLPVGLRLDMDESTRRKRTDGSDAYDFTCRTACADPAICGSSEALRAWVAQDPSIWQGLASEPFADRNLPRPHF